MEYAGPWQGSVVAQLVDAVFCDGTRESRRCRSCCLVERVS